MKKLTLVLVLMMVITTILSTTAFSFEIPIRVVVNGQKINFPDANPFIDENGRTQVPVRFVGEALGADVGWDGNTRTVTVEQGRNKISLVVGKSEYTINSRTVKMDTTVVIVDDRTFVPVRFVSEALGADVDWDAEIKTVYITTGVAPTPSPEDGNVSYYDGIAFNDATDVDEYGAMTIEKSQEFLLKMTDQLSFVKENGKYYIVGEYPELPEEFEWGVGIGINHIVGGTRNFSSGTARKDYLIPREGAFKKDTTGLIDMDNIDSFNIVIGIYRKGTTYSLGILDILYVVYETASDDTTRRVNFVPESSRNSYIDYTDTFNFEKMFQW